MQRRCKKITALCQKFSSAAVVMRAGVFGRGKKGTLVCILGWISEICMSMQGARERNHVKVTCNDVGVFGEQAACVDLYIVVL